MLESPIVIVTELTSPDNTLNLRVIDEIFPHLHVRRPQLVIV